MEKLYDHIVPGGIISIDQRTQGGETNAIMIFATTDLQKLRQENFLMMFQHIVKNNILTKLIVELSINHSGHLNNKK